jgi:polysaccharide biosynthesis transport protein
MGFAKADLTTGTSVATHREETIFVSLGLEMREHMKPATALSPKGRGNLDPAHNLAPLQEPSGFRNRIAPPETGTYAEYARIVSRWWMVIVGCAVAGALLSLSFTLHVLPVYQARTSLDIESINGDFLNMKDVAATSDSGASSSEAYVETEIKLLQSRTVLDQTVAKMKARPHATALDRDDLISKWKRALHLSNGRDLPYTVMLEDTARRITIKPMGKTRIVEITCASWDPKFAAEFCNEMTTQFKAIDLETRSSEAAKTSEFLTRQVADVREKAEQSEQKLELATGGDALALSKESNSLGEDHLRELEGEIVRAQADRLQRESELQIATNVQPDSVPAAADNPADREYEQMIAVLNSKIAELMPPLTEQHPKIIHLRSEIKAVQDAMEQERAKTLEKLKNKYDAARSYESRLNAVYSAAQANVSNEMSKTERVDLLRREVDSETQLYQTLLQRAKEAGFASAMETTTMRIVDAAATPKVPISPSRGTATISGLALGSLCGVGFAFYKHRTMKFFLAPGDSERFLNVYELGAVPSVSFVRSRSFYSVLRLKNSNAATEEAPPALATWKETVSIVTEAFRNVTHSILLSGPLIRRPRIYTVVSPNSGEGKSTVTANLGVAFSKSRMKVVVVDADMRKPSQHKNLGVSNDCGLRNVLREEFDVSAAPLEKFCKQSAIPNLWVVAAGEGDEQPVELLQSKAVASMLKRLTTEFDLVLIDTPPMLHMADARILSAQADGVVLVFRAGVTDRSDAADVCARIENDNITLIGTILNDFNAGRDGRRGYYSSYFKYMNSVNAARNTA